MNSQISEHPAHNAYIVHVLDDEAGNPPGVLVSALPCSNAPLFSKTPQATHGVPLSTTGKAGDWHFEVNVWRSCGRGEIQHLGNGRAGAREGGANGFISSSWLDAL